MQGAQRKIVQSLHNDVLELKSQLHALGEENKALRGICSENEVLQNEVCDLKSQLNELREALVHRRCFEHSCAQHPIGYTAIGSDIMRIPPIPLRIASCIGSSSGAGLISRCFAVAFDQLEEDFIFRDKWQYAIESVEPELSKAQPPAAPPVAPPAAPPAAHFMKAPRIERREASSNFSVLAQRALAGIAAPEVIESSLNLEEEVAFCLARNTSHQLIVRWVKTKLRAVQFDCTVLGFLVTHIDWRIRTASVLAVGEIQGEARLADAVATRLTDFNEEVRRASAEALGKMGAAGVKHAGAVATLLTDSVANLAWDILVQSMLVPRY